MAEATMSGMFRLTSATASPKTAARAQRRIMVNCARRCSIRTAVSFEIFIRDPEWPYATAKANNMLKRLPSQLAQLRIAACLIGAPGGAKVVVIIYDASKRALVQAEPRRLRPVRACRFDQIQ